MSVPQDISQTNLRLPIELMVKIIDESLDLRLRQKGGRREDPPRRFPVTTTQQNAIGPLIRSCKLFASIIIPKVYRDVILRKQYSIELFLDRARFSSLGHMKTLHVDFFAVQDLCDRAPWYAGRLPELVDLRRMQTHLHTPRDFTARYATIDGGTDYWEEGDIASYMVAWEFLHRPRLEHLEVNGDIARHLLPDLLRLSVHSVLAIMVCMLIDESEI
jgi:hypothetical protein